MHTIFAPLSVLDPWSDGYAKVEELRHRKTTVHTTAGKPLKINQDRQDKTLGDAENRSPDRMKTRKKGAGFKAPTSNGTAQDTHMRSSRRC
jgi:hypothetical protein